MLGKVQSVPVTQNKENLQSASTNPVQLNLSEYHQLLKKNDFRLDLESSYSTHFLSIKFRSSLINWLLDIILAYRASLRTFHLCIRLMDLYCTKVKNLLPVDLYKVSVTSLFMAFKYEEVKPISINAICLKVTQNIVTRTEVLQLERKILIVLEFNMFIPTLFDFCEVFMQECNEDEKEYMAFLRDISVVDLELASKLTGKLAEAIFLIVTRKKLPTQGPLALCIQEIVALIEGVSPVNLPSFFERYGKFWNKL